MMSPEIQKLVRATIKTMKAYEEAKGVFEEAEAELDSRERDKINATKVLSDALLKRNESVLATLDGFLVRFNYESLTIESLTEVEWK